VQSTPKLILQLKNIKKLAAVGNYVQALDASGNVFSWGSGGQGQLGCLVMENYRLNALTPSRFGLPKKRINQISCVSHHSFSIGDWDRIYAWGLSNFGQTGISDGAGERNAMIHKPSVVKALADFKISEIGGGNHHSVACSEDERTLGLGKV
jgi:regulator of chromosome condensation